MTLAKSKGPTPVNEPILAYAPNSPERAAIKSELRSQRSECVDIFPVINGKQIKGTHKVPVVSPHQHKHVLAHTHHATKADIESAVSGAKKAQVEWANLRWEDRAAVFLKAADLLATKYRAPLNAATMLGQSKTVFQAEIDAACELIDFFRFNVHFMEQIYEIQPYSPAGQWNRSEARPLEGFVLAVTPFNFTSIALNLPTAPILMGCSVLWKPAHTSMLSSYVGMQLLQEAGLPAGVLNMVPADHKNISEVLLPHKDLAGIHFTGSTQTFNFMWGEISKNIGNYKSYPRIVGETGGKDFVFAHPSADTKALVTALVRGSFEYQGQKCSAASRAYIPKSLWPTVKEGLIETLKTVKMGDPEDFKNFMGAVIDQKSFNRIKSYIDHAKNSSQCTIVAGGECDDKIGYFVQPTVIETKDPHYKSMVEEIFGPVLTVYVYDDQKFSETIELCNTSTPYALTGAIFAQDRAVISQMSAMLQNAAGNFYINDKPTGAVVGQQPFGGARASGTNDKAGSVLNLLRWTSFRSIKETFNPPYDYRYPFMQES